MAWLGLNERGGATLVEGADAESFVVEDQGAHDRHGMFIGAERVGGPLPVEPEPDPLVAATALIHSLWQELVVHWFTLFDGSLPNAKWSWTGPTAPLRPSAIPQPG